MSPSIQLGGVKLLLIVLFFDRWGWKGVLVYVGCFLIGTVVETCAQEQGERMCSEYIDGILVVSMDVQEDS